MDLLVRRRALLAAAKVALSLSIVACSAAVEDPTSQDDTTNDYLRKKNDAGPAATHDCGTKAPPTTTCGIPKTGVDAAAPVASEELTCCTSFIASKRSDAGEGWMTLPADAKKDPDIVACCGAIVANGVSWGDDAGIATAPYDVVQSCCQVTGFRSVACTPWGPPAPPAMTKLRRDELVALMLADMMAADTMAEVA
jgi:hypothetical protein